MIEPGLRFTANGKGTTKRANRLVNADNKLQNIVNKLADNEFKLENNVYKGESNEFKGEPVILKGESIEFKLANFEYSPETLGLKLEIETFKDDSVIKPPHSATNRDSNRRK